MSDSGRLALNLIGESVRSAGNLACNSAMSATSQTLLPVVFDNNYGQGIAGFEANGTAPAAAIALPALPVAGAVNNWTPNLDPTVMVGAAPPPPGLGLPVQGSDVLVVRSSVPRVPPVYTTADVAPGANNVFVTPVPVSMTAAPYPYAAIADCTKSVIFRVTAVAPGAPSSVSLNPGLPVGFSAGALVAPLTTTVYYIGTGSDGDSSLWRIEQVNGPAFAAEELVPDVENMQVLYGIDPTGTQTAAAYVTANQVGAVNVVSIQLALLVASPLGTKPIPALPPYNLLGTLVTVPADNRLRQVFNATINLRDAVN
jgi:type IV pilus assembly protein PilW